MTPVRTAARALLSAIFVTSGAQAVAKPDALVPRAKPVTDAIAPVLAKTGLPIPSDTRTLVRINGAVQVAGGLALLTPLRRVGALALAGSLIPTTLAGHPFWKHEDPAERAQQRVNFFKNVSLFGATVLAALDNDGRPGLAWRAEHLVDDTSRAVHRAAGNARSKATIARRSARVGHASAVVTAQAQRRKDDLARKAHLR